MTFGGMGDPNTPNLEELLQLGVRTAKSGNKEGAKVMFQKVLDVDKRNERAWLWLASVSEDEFERRGYLETVLQINPNNTTAKKYLSAMNNAVAAGDSESMMLGIRILLGVVAIVVVAVLIALIFSR
jgi:hypothetical protein